VAGWVFQVSGDLPRWLARMVAWQRRVAGADQFRSAPIHRSESPTGYSSAGCSPAEPASASPVADNSTSNPGPARQSKCAAQPHCRDPVQVTLLLPVTHGVSSLLCTPGDISILRRQLLIQRSNSVSACDISRSSALRPQCLFVPGQLAVVTAADARPNRSRSRHRGSRRDPASPPAGGADPRAAHAERIPSRGVI